MSQRMGSVGLAVLSCASLLLSGSVLATSDTSTSLCVPRFFSDGDCDLVNDNEECGKSELLNEVSFAPKRNWFLTPVISARLLTALMELS